MSVPSRPAGFSFYGFHVGNNLLRSGDQCRTTSNRISIAFQNPDGPSGQLEAQEKYSQALDLYNQTLIHYPKSQRAVLQAAVCLEKLGRTDEALLNYDHAINMNPAEYWAEAALFYKSRTCLAVGKKQNALATIERLKQEYPDSSFTIRAGILTAKAEGRSIDAAQDLFAQELEAAQAYEEGRTLSSERRNKEAMAKLCLVTENFPRSAAALRAFEAIGHLYIREGRTDEAIRTFSVIVDKLAASSPKSRIVQTAQTRLAALHHNSGRRAEAAAIYADLLKNGGDTTVMANAMLQKAGIEFENLQRATWKKEAVSEVQWDELRAHCRSVLGMEKAAAKEKARAELMVVESYAWQGRRHDQVEAGLKFLQHHDPAKVKQEIASVQIFVGEGLLKLERYGEAVDQFRAVLAAYEGKTEADFWGGDLLAKTHFYLWRTLPLIGASADEQGRVEQALLERFPNSAYAGVVRSIASNREENK